MTTIRGVDLPPLSPRVEPEGTRFRVVSRRPPTLWIEGRPDPLRPGRAGDHWEAFAPGVGAGDRYAWAVEPDQRLVDPCCLALDPGPPVRSLVVAPPPPPAWERPTTPLHESVIYELHVRGFTRHPASGVRRPGTFLGLTEKIDYLRDLGVTAVELMPVQAFDDRAGGGRVNFWGYSPIAWFAPHPRYAVADAIGEFRTMVRAFHAAGIQVLLDVVFNHTGERDSTGPTWNLRALDPERYYLGKDLTGCGNTVRVQEPSVRALVLDCLRWWVHGMGVDGFRFDLATILTRDEEGEPMEEPPLIRAIEEDESLRGIQLIAEAWDAAGGYQVGSWPGGPRWAVWNDRFRDDVRRAWLAGGVRTGDLAARLCGSSDLFRHGPSRGINYVTAHDGFSLLDAVSYARKHNEANGERNRDGHEHEVSANFGVEGPSDDAQVRRTRDRARRNLVASLLLAQGTPMLAAGDEFGRTQRGNNNAYCHDSELTWIDWTGLDRDAEFHAFVRDLIRLRRRTPFLRRTAFLRDEEIEWLGPGGREVEWNGGAVGYRLDDLLVLLNPTKDTVDFELPGGEHAWRCLVRTDSANGTLRAFSLALFTRVCLRNRLDSAGCGCG